MAQALVRRRYDRRRDFRAVLLLGSASSAFCGRASAYRIARRDRSVEQDGGAITFHSFHEGIVTVTLQGSCSGCPSSTITLKAGIENLFKRMMPEEVKGVEALG